MIILRGKTANELFVNIAQEMLASGKSSCPRNLKTLEICDAWLILENPAESIVTLPERNLNLNYLNSELEWYKDGSLDIHQIKAASSFWSKLADTNGTVNSNYGVLALKQKWSGK